MSEARPLLSRVLPHAVGGVSLDDMTAGADLFKLTAAGRIVGAFATQVHETWDGRVLFVTAAGGLPGHDLTAAMDAWLEAQARGHVAARELRAVTQRRGMVRRLMRAGWRIAEQDDGGAVVMTKDV